MHEVAIARLVAEDADRLAGGRRVKAVELQVGELASLSAGELKRALEGLCGWSVAVAEVPAVGECACGFRGRPRVLERAHDFVLFDCPSCGGGPVLLQGGDIKITRVVTV